MKPTHWLSAAAGTMTVLACVVTGSTPAIAASWGGSWQGCGNNVRLCTEVDDASTAFGHYVGHDEPSVLFYSNTAGSGNHVQWNVTLPVEPTGTFSDTKGYTAELTPAFWFGMAMCDSQSYPEQTTQCTPDTDANITDPASTKKAPGAAYMELQFYPPGFAPQFSAFSCDATRWCAAMTIDSLAEDPINGTTLNQTCTKEIGGSIEYVNFAYLTESGAPLGPPNPYDFQFINSGDPQPVAGRAHNDTLFMNQGDNLTVTITDTANGLLTHVLDNTTGQSGFMVASGANGFGQIKYLPYGNNCTELPYDFHPMYSTSSPATRVLWAAHSYNVAFDAEIGHFDFCTQINANTGNCSGLEGIPGDQEAADSEDYGCFSTAENLNTAYQPPLGQPAAYCLATNDPGFDGTSYQNYWPNGSATNPTPIRFSSPLTGSGYGTAYDQTAFETDLPRIEAADLGGHCNRTTGVGCTNPPPTDDGTPVTFYPYFSTLHNGRGSCVWGVGSTLPATITNFGGTAQYGPLYQLTYYAFGGHGATVKRYNDYRTQTPFAPPC